MFDGRSSQSHELRGGALVHTIQSTIVHVAAQDALGGGGAARLERAAAAVGGLGLVVDAALLAMKLLAIERLACRALEAVALRLVYEAAAVEEVSITLIVDGAVGRHMRNQPGGLAAPCLFAVRVARVGHDVDQRRRANPPRVLPRPSAPVAGCRLRPA